jgi:hypothetical protein
MVIMVFMVIYGRGKGGGENWFQGLLKQSKIAYLPYHQTGFPKFAIELHDYDYNGSMDNFRRGLHSHLGAGAKTSLGVSLTEFEQ